MDSSDKSKKKITTQKKNSLINTKWVATIMVVSLVLSMSLSYLSNEALANANTVVSFVILLVFIGLGIIFDMIGVAATSATEKEFHSMAAHKVKGAKQAVWMTRNAEKVSSICNDVIGDISGIISGATGAVIVAEIVVGMSTAKSVLVSLIVTGLISALTIGGKAACKGIAIAGSRSILVICGKFLSFLPISYEQKR